MEIPHEMIRRLNRVPASKGEYILYWMQQSQRAEYNNALKYAVREANRRRLPLVVIFGLTTDYPDANSRHYAFMLEGLAETQADLAQRGIRMVVRTGHPPEVALAAGKNAAAVICDRGYLRHQRQWRREVARAAGCPVIQVESDAILPVETVYPKAAYNARILRLKINGLIKNFLIPHEASPVKIPSIGIQMPGDTEKHVIDLNPLSSVLNHLKFNDEPVAPSPLFAGGTAHAKAHFNTFLEKKLAVYDRHSNQPQMDDVSHMSPYLHFGQISPLWLALRIKAVQEDCPEGAAAYFEELIVRRELAINYVHYTKGYDRFESLPPWARKTLREHRADERPITYTSRELAQAKTHDPYWNAAMNEMVHTGFMHNYMRMYWGKKVLEWSESPEAAFERLILMNNKYFIDGRDPNSYAGVAWIFGLHDRAWKERPIFGKVRYMAASGLERKCDIRAYVRKVEGQISSISASAGNL